MQAKRHFDKQRLRLTLWVAVAMMAVLAHGQSPKQAKSPHVSLLASGGAVLPMARLSSADGSGHSLHMMVGRTTMLTTKDRLHRVYVANPSVLESFTSSPNQIVLTARAPGVSSLIVWDETGQSQSYLVSSDIDIESLRTSLRQALPAEDVRAEANEGRITLSGSVSSEALSEAAVKMAALYSKDIANSMIVNPAHIKQVKLKVRIVEVDRSRLTQFGFNFFSLAGNTLAATTTGQFQSSISVTPATGGGSSSGGTGSNINGQNVTTSDPLNFLLYNTNLNIGATVKDLEDKQILQVLAEPTITTLSGQRAAFLAGGEFPYPVVQSGSTGFASVTIQFRPFGVKLDFTPQVNADGTIQLKVAPEVSALDYTNAVTISGYTIPAIATRRADTQVELRSGQSFAISGLLDRRTTDALGRTPGIANIPIIGELFKSKGITHSVSELIVIVTPTVVDPLTDHSEPVEPSSVIKFMEPQAFDQSLPGQKKKK